MSLLMLIFFNQGLYLVNKKIQTKIQNSCVCCYPPHTHVCRNYHICKNKSLEIKRMTFLPPAVQWQPTASALSIYCILYLVLELRDNSVRQMCEDRSSSPQKKKVYWGLWEWNILSSTVCCDDVSLRMGLLSRSKPKCAQVWIIIVCQSVILVLFLFDS